MRPVAAALAIAALTAGCGAKTPDYQSIWAKDGAVTTTAQPSEEDLLSVGRYLESKGVTAVAVAPGEVPDLTVSIPTPPGWSKRENAQLPKTTQVIGKGETFPSAVLTVLRLDGDFDPAETVKHGLAEAQQLQNFTLLDASTGDFNGFPSSVVQGNHDLNGQRVHSWFRMVIPTVQPSGQRYLVQLAIMTLAEQAAKQAGDAESIMNGFTVKAK
ncbi:LpqN/LpqT family lipoprotein [Mycobacterium sp. M1]|uniref:LpqN/LpqT family lipoprotein n=1 Tax=Mycolicibacter acidiphilus TaxID=2835306 RepID=A0ABS5RNY7_9MYCO|nr:LpqN/LpqT family lipoprotein [Mycolicibacter acidiphilus]MBS9536015.1 LpqN/LpqT family lipoprotein [Mycolicibacter acidiphilus]